MVTVTSSEVRRRFGELIQKAEHEVVQITEYGQPAAALISWQVYQDLLETLQILGDTRIMSNVRAGLGDIDGGRINPWFDVRMRLVGTK